MKNLLMVLAASTMTIAPLAAVEAAPRYSADKQVKHNNGKRTVNITKTTTAKKTTKAKKTSVKARQTKRQWKKGQRFERRYATNYRVINNPRAYRLSSAPRGYHWVRSGNDAVLISIASGSIRAVAGNSFHR